MGASQQTEQKAFLIFLGLLLVTAIYIVHYYLQALCLIFILTILFSPVYKKYLHWTRNRKGLAAFLSVLSVIIFFLIPVGILITLVITQLSGLINFNADAAVAGLNDVSLLFANLQKKMVLIGSQLEAFFGVKINLTSLLRDQMKQLSEFLAQYSPVVLTGTAAFFFQMIVVIIGLFYCFRHGAEFLKLCIRLSPIKDQYEKVLAKEIHRTINGVFYGSFLTALAQAASATLGFYLAGLEGYFVWGLITFFVSFIPLFGTGTLLLPLTLFLFVQGHFKQGVFLAIYGGIIVGGLDNLLRSFLIPSNMHPFILLLSILGGLVTFGPLGLLLGPILMAILTATLNIYSRDFID